MLYLPEFQGAKSSISGDEVISACASVPVGVSRTGGSLLRFPHLPQRRRLDRTLAVAGAIRAIRARSKREDLLFVAVQVQQ